MICVPWALMTHVLGFSELSHRLIQWLACRLFKNELYKKSFVPVTRANSIRNAKRYYKCIVITLGETSNLIMQYLHKLQYHINRPLIGPEYARLSKYHGCDCPGPHDDVIKWNSYLLRYWPFVRGIHRSPVNSPHKGQWRGALMFSLICVRINGWVNNREACDLRRYRAHYDVTVVLASLYHHESYNWP